MILTGGCVALFVVSHSCSGNQAFDHKRLHSNPMTIQLYSDTDTGHSKLSIRSPVDDLNATFGAGLNGVTLSDNQQYVSPFKLLLLRDLP